MKLQEQSLAQNCLKKAQKCQILQLSSEKHQRVIILLMMSLALQVRISFQVKSQFWFVLKIICGILTGNCYFSLQREVVKD